MHKDESELEDELRLALRRVEPPSHFATGVLARVASDKEEQRKASGLAALTRADQADRSRWFGASVGAGFAGRFAARLVASFSPPLAAALLLILLLPLGGYLHRRHQQAQAELAAQQFSLAMRLTHAALVNAGQQIAEHGHARESDE